MVIRNLQHVCLRVSRVCHLHMSAVYRQPYTPSDNPGVYRRVKLISQDEPDIDRAGIDEESIEELEEDFMQAGEMHDDIISEMKRISKRREYKITERKHFRLPKEPSMLTWSEREHMTLLHQTDPEKWTPEVLADSFPASPAIIKKILKNKWRPLSAERIKEYDKKVSENWVAFHRGKLEVHDLRLREHLKKFTDRQNGTKVISDEEAKNATEINLPRPKNTEFLSLVSSFKPKEESSTSEAKIKQIQDVSNHNKTEKTNALDIIDKSNANYTLDQFRQRLEREAENLPEIPEEMKAIIGSRKPKSIDSPSSERYVAPSERFRPDAVVYAKRKKSHLTLVVNDVPDQIEIPKDQWQPGLVYRVNDCFYNDRGNFLYRVPGLKTD